LRTPHRPQTFGGQTAADNSPVRPWLSPDPGLTEDEEVATLAMGYPLAFATKFAEAVVVSGLDTGESAASGPGNAMLDAGLEKWPMGELPEEEERDVPQDTVIGFRSMGGTLAELFYVGVIGRLAPVTCVGAIVE
jgi:hypothetical protein